MDGICSEKGGFVWQAVARNERLLREHGYSTIEEGETCLAKMRGMFPHEGRKAHGAQYTRMRRSATRNMATILLLACLWELLGVLEKIDAWQGAEIATVVQSAVPPPSIKVLTATYCLRATRRGAKQLSPLDRMAAAQAHTAFGISGRIRLSRRTEHIAH